MDVRCLYSAEKPSDNWFYLAELKSSDLKSGSLDIINESLE